VSNEKIKGGRLEWNADDFYRIATSEAEKAMTKAAIYLQGVVRRMVGGIGSGKIYKRGRKTHQASLPGKPPARDSGILASSISYDVKKIKNMVHGHVGAEIEKIKRNQKTATTDVNYAAWLETGTKRGMKKRPYLKPSLIKAKPKIVTIFKKAFEK